MVYFKQIYKSLMRKKVSSIFIVIQLTITIFILINSFTMLDSTNYLINEAKHSKLDLDKTIHLQIYNGSFSDEYNKNYIQLEEYINSMKGISNYGGFDFTNTIFIELENNNEYIKCRQEMINDTFKERYDTSSELILLDQGMYDLMKLPIMDGRGLETNDFYDEDNEITPILVGNRYKDILKIGQVITRVDDEHKYIVVGIIEGNCRWFNEQDYISNMLNSLDDKFIVPYIKSEKTSTVNILSKSNAIFYVVNDTEQIEYIEKMIDKKAETLNLRVRSSSILDELSEYKENIIEVNQICIFLAISLIIFSCFGISTIMISSIINRKREFGIMMSTGASIRYIKKIIIGEMATLTIISSLLAILIQIIDNIKKYKFEKYYAITINPMEYVSIKCIIFVTMSVLIIVMVTSIFPLRKLKKITIKEFIGGVE